MYGFLVTILVIIVAVNDFYIFLVGSVSDKEENTSKDGRSSFCTTVIREQHFIFEILFSCLKKNLNASRPSEHPLILVDRAPEPTCTSSCFLCY